MLQKALKVAQKAKNRQLWSHCYLHSHSRECYFQILLSIVASVIFQSFPLIAVTNVLFSVSPGLILTGAEPTTFYKNGPSRPLFRLFSVFFKQTLSFLQQINVKK